MAMLILSCANFYPRPPRGGRLVGNIYDNPDLLFLSTPSARRATCMAFCEECYGKISIHALREEGDICSLGYDQLAQIFLSTPSARRATYPVDVGRKRAKYFYPRPPRGGRRADPAGGGGRGGISIHALREEGDTMPKLWPLMWSISIHALREEGDTTKTVSRNVTASFLSTPSARRATKARRASCSLCMAFLSTPSARRATTEADTKC